MLILKERFLKIYSGSIKTKKEDKNVFHTLGRHLGIAAYVYTGAAILAAICEKMERVLGGALPVRRYLPGRFWRAVFIWYNIWYNFWHVLGHPV